jgi:hypothetical protein
MWMRMMPDEAVALSTLGLISKAECQETVNRYIPPIVVEAYGGLGNRLKALVSAMCAGSDLGKDARVIWKVTGDCGAKFSDLFEAVVVPRVFVHDELSVGYVQHDCDTQTQWDDVSGTKTVTYLKSGARFHTTADAEFAGFLKGLKPQNAIAADVAALGDLSAVVGVHIRSKENAVSVASSPQAAFVTAMTALPSTTKFFVAADSDDVRLPLEAAFPGRIVTVAKDLTRSKDGLEDALKDFLALSQCSQVLGSKGSSFSEMAALYGGKTLTVVTA